MKIKTEGLANDALAKAEEINALLNRYPLRFVVDESDLDLRKWAIEQCSTGNTYSLTQKELFNSADALIKYVTGESDDDYFFAQDDSCHWYMIPALLETKWLESKKLDLDSIEGYEEWQKGGWEQYMTGGGISDIKFRVI